jgi:hypothetical protein
MAAVYLEWFACQERDSRRDLQRQDQFDDNG